MDAARKARAREGARDVAKNILRRIEGALKALEAGPESSRKRLHMSVLRKAIAEVQSFQSASRREFDRLDKHGLLSKASSALEDDESSGSNNGSSNNSGSSDSHGGRHGDTRQS